MTRRAFTLLELLCVLAIIASLASLLLPVLPRAKAAVKTSVCISNLHQIGSATEMYLADNEDHYPFSINEVERQHPYLYAFLGRPKGMDPSGMKNNVELLSPYVKGPGIWLCPLDSGRDFLDTQAPATPTLALFNGGSSFFLADLVNGQSGTVWSDPSSDAFGMDGSQRWHGGQTYYTSRWNVLFYDGHVKSELTSVVEGPHYMP